jgi:hypothetical protein
MTTLERTLPVTLLLVLAASGCGSDEPIAADTGATSTDTSGGESGSEGDMSLCEPGSEQVCMCPDGSDGTQVCEPSGDAWGECQCEPPPVCGDGLCEEERGEDCAACEADCGICLDCAEAPSCTNAAVPDGIDTHLEALDLLPEEGMPLPPHELSLRLTSKVGAGDPGVRVVAAALDGVAIPGEHPFVTQLRGVFVRYPEQAAIVRRQLARAGLTDLVTYREQFPEPRTLAIADTLAPRPQGDPADCMDPKLRIRMAKITVHDASDLLFDDEVYCAVISEAMPGAEIRVTPTTFALDNGMSYDYALAEGVVWGQLGEPVAALGSLSMTYNCLEADGTGGIQEFLDAIADGAANVPAIPGPYGWVIPVIGLAAEIIGAALALETDDHLFNASQIIPEDLQLEMTNGVWWSVRRTGMVLLDSWDWELRLEAWGCTDDGIG